MKLYNLKCIPLFNSLNINTGNKFMLNEILYFIPFIPLCYETYI